MTVNRASGGTVTARVDGDTTVQLDAKRTYELRDIGINSAGATQTTGRVLYTVDGTAPQASFAEAPGRLFLIQSTAAADHPRRCSGVSVLRLIALTAESTVEIRPIL